MIPEVLVIFIVLIVIVWLQERKPAHIHQPLSAKLLLISAFMVEIMAWTASIYGSQRNLYDNCRIPEPYVSYTIVLGIAALLFVIMRAVVLYGSSGKPMVKPSILLIAAFLVASYGAYFVAALCISG